MDGDKGRLFVGDGGDRMWRVVSVEIVLSVVGIGEEVRWGFEVV